MESFPLLKARDIQLYFNKIAERDPFFKVIFSKLIKDVVAFYLFYFNRKKQNASGKIKGKRDDWNIS